MVSFMSSNSKAKRRKKLALSVLSFALFYCLDLGSDQAVCGPVCRLFPVAMAQPDKQNSKQNTENNSERYSYRIQAVQAQRDNDFDALEKSSGALMRLTVSTKKQAECPYIEYSILHIKALIGQRKTAAAVKEYRDLLAFLAQRKESYLEADCLAVDLLYLQGKSKEALDAALGLIKRVGPSDLLIYNLNVSNQKLRRIELKAALVDLELQRRKERIQILNRLRAIMPTKSILKVDQALQLVCHTGCFPRFKLTLQGERVAGDSGIVRYLITPPQYGKAVLINDDSHNYLSIAIKELLLDHCGYSEPHFDYSTVSKLGSEKFCGLNADVYKISMVGDSSYQILKVARDVQLSAPLSEAISKICLIYPIGALPLELKYYRQGSTHEVLRVEKAAFVPAGTTAAAFALPKTYNSVRNMGELIYAEDGALKDSDLDSMLSTGSQNSKGKMKARP